MRRTPGLARAGVVRLRGRGDLARTGPWRLRVARKAGVCGVCGRGVRAGDVVYWRARGSNPRHGVCHEQARPPPASSARRRVSARKRVTSPAARSR